MPLLIRCTCSITFIIVALSGSLLLAKAKKKEIPHAILTARTVYIDVSLLSFQTEHATPLRKRVVEWKRFRVAKDAKEADLVLLFEPDGDFMAGGRLTVFDRSGKALWVIQTDRNPDIRFIYLIDVFHEQINDAAKSAAQNTLPKKP